MAYVKALKKIWLWTFGWDLDICKMFDILNSLHINHLWLVALFFLDFIEAVLRVSSNLDAHARKIDQN